MPELKCDRVGHALLLARGATWLSLVLSVVLSLGVVSATITTPARAATSTTSAAPLTLANNALGLARTQIDRRQYSAAIRTLGALRTYVRSTNAAAMAQIGKPPTDPESDDPPGPPAVIAALAMENRVTTVLVPRINGKTGPYINTAMSYTLYVTHTVRQQMLTKVTGLDPEGDGSDYADDMTDTVPLYSAEVALVTNALRTYRLTSAARVGLKRTLTQVRAAYATMNAAYGGGE